MDSIIYKLRLEATKPGRQAAVHVVKDDAGTRVVEATITSNGKPLSFHGATVALWANVAGTDQFISGEILEDEMTARVVLPTSIIEVPGEFDAELRYIESATARVITSARFVIVVSANLYDSEAVEAQDNFDALAAYVAMARGTVEHYPRISGTTGNWEVYDAESDSWEDTGVHAKGDTGATGPQGPKGDKGDTGEDGTKVSVGNAISQDGQSHPRGDKVDDVYINNVSGDMFKWNGTVWRIDGNIKGAKGDPGEDGQDGYTPVRGVDYWTAADQAAIVADVLAALPTAEGGAY